MNVTISFDFYERNELVFITFDFSQGYKEIGSFNISNITNDIVKNLVIFIDSILNKTNSILKIRDKNNFIKQYIDYSNGDFLFGTLSEDYSMYVIANSSREILEEFRRLRQYLISDTEDRICIVRQKFFEDELHKEKKKRLEIEWPVLKKEINPRVKTLWSTSTKNPHCEEV